jgi:predicted transcriptional regulator
LFFPYLARPTHRDRNEHMNTASTESHPPSCRDLVGLLAQSDRRAAYAALALGATSVAEVAEVAGLRPPAAAAALQKLTDGRVAAFAKSGQARSKASAVQGLSTR